MNDFKAKEGKEPLLTAPLGARAVLFELHAKLTREGDPQVPDKKPSDETSKVSADAAVDVSADARPEEEVEAAETKVGDPKEQCAALERENRALEEEASRLKALKSTRKDDCEGLRIQLQAIEDEMESFRAAMEKLGQDRLHHIDTLNEGVRQCGEAGTEAVSTIHGAVNNVRQTITVTAAEAADGIHAAGTAASDKIQHAGNCAVKSITAYIATCTSTLDAAEKSAQQFTDATAKRHELIAADAQARVQLAQDLFSASDKEEKALTQKIKDSQQRVDELRKKSAFLEGILQGVQSHENASKKSWFKKAWDVTMWPLLILTVFGVIAAGFWYATSSEDTADEYLAMGQDEQTAPAASNKYITPAASAVPAVATTDSGKPEGLADYEMDADDMVRMWPSPDGKGGKIHQVLNRKGASDTFDLYTCPVQGKEANRFYCDKYEIVLECKN